MSEPNSIESLIGRFLEDRDGLSDDEFRRLIEALRSQPQLAEVLKDHLMIEEQLAQQFAKTRRDFPAKFEQRRQGEATESSFNRTQKIGDSAIETYALRRSDEIEIRSNGSASGTRLPAESNKKPAPAPAESKKPRRPAENDSGHPWRMFFAVMLFLLLLAGGLLRLEYSVAARKIAVVDEADGMSLIYRDGVGIVAAAGMPILPRDEIRIQDDGRLSFTYRDETRGWIQAGTTLQFQPDAAKMPGFFTAERAKELMLSEGRVELDVRPQPANRPMVLRTPQVEAEVLGTRLILTVQDEQSRVEVLEGRVRVESLKLPQPPVELTAGQQVLATIEEFLVSPGPWPSDRTGLVFLLLPSATQSQPPNEGLRVHAEGQNHSSVLLRPRGSAQLEQGRLTFRGGAFLADDKSATELLAACKRSNEFSLEMTFQTPERSQIGPARWITFSTSSDAWNFSLAQEGTFCLLRLLTDSKQSGRQGHELRLFEIPDDKPHHVAVTYSPGELRCYLDGQPIAVDSPIQGDFASWKPQQLLFGDEWNGDRQWIGDLAGIAIYDRVLSADEAARNALHYRLRFDQAEKVGGED